VIGINSAIASNTGFYAGYGFAIPITLAKQVMDDIIQYGKVRRAVLGINIQEVDPNDAQVAGLKEIRGVKVSGFDPADDPESSPAKRGGVEVGDVIVAVNGQQVDHVSALQRVIRNFKPGQTVSLDVMRFGDKKTLNVKLGEPPADKTSDIAAANDDSREPVATGNERSYDKLGISVQPVPTDVARNAQLSDQWRRGLLVTDVSPTGPAYRELSEGSSIIVRVLYPQKRDIRSAADFEDVVSKLKKGDLITLLVYDVRAQGTTSITLKAQ
jgi:serine protease Do